MLQFIIQRDNWKVYNSSTAEKKTTLTITIIINSTSNITIHIICLFVCLSICLSVRFSMDLCVLNKGMNEWMHGFIIMITT